MTIGVAYVLMSPKPTTRTVAGTHQRRPKRRMANTSTAPPSAASSAPIAVLLGTFAPQPVQLWVTSPTPFARSRAIADTGSVATVMATDKPAATAAPESTGRRANGPRGGR